MQLLSRVTGQEVRTPGGTAIGRVSDLTVHLGEQSGPLLVARLLVRRRHSADLLVPWEAVRSFQRSGVVLESDAGFTVGAVDAALEPDEILLKRDVLDTQIVDVVGQRIARVADVVLAGAAGHRIELVGVEVGFGAVLRRLGLHRLARRARADVVGWTDLHLTSERGHAVQLATPRSAVHLLAPRELAVLLSRLDTESAAEVLRVKDPDFAADVVREIHPVVGERVLRALPSTDAAEIVAAMPAVHETQWRRRLAHSPALRGRPFLRSHVWPR